MLLHGIVNSLLVLLHFCFRWGPIPHRCCLLHDAGNHYDVSNHYDAGNHSPCSPLEISVQFLLLSCPMRHQSGVGARDSGYTVPMSQCGDRVPAGFSFSFRCSSSAPCLSLLFLSSPVCVGGPFGPAWPEA